MSSKTVLVIFLALTAAACAGDGPRLVSHVNSSYDWYAFTSYHQNRDTLVEIHGNPLGLDMGAFGRSVTAAMQPRHSGVRSHFTTTPGPSAEKNLRVVLAFNSAPESGNLCRAKTYEALPGSGITQVLGAWCWDDRPDSVVTARIAPVTSIDDPRFLRLVAETTRELFPPRKDENRNNRDRSNRKTPSS